jgi:uncharacterized LabA/DUF88 family protein
MSKPLYAILLDGGFVTKRLYQKLGRHAVADDIEAECARLQCLPQFADYELLRIYYYDAFPSGELVSTPVGRRNLNLGTTERHRLSRTLYDNLVLKPQFALRMGQVNLSVDKWIIKPRVAKELVRTPRPLTDEDFSLDLSQKGVDMRVGMDMARLALRELVRAIVVVTGDSDFVPAFKFVRREGVKVFLEPLGHNVRVELRHHSDFVLEASRDPAPPAPVELPAEPPPP